MYWLVVLVAIGGALAMHQRSPRFEGAHQAPSERIPLADSWKRVTKVERVEYVVIATGMAATICLVVFAVELMLLSMK